MRKKDGKTLKEETKDGKGELQSARKRPKEGRFKNHNWKKKGVSNALKRQKAVEKRPKRIQNQSQPSQR